MRTINVVQLIAFSGFATLSACRGTLVVDDGPPRGAAGSLGTAGGSGGTSGTDTAIGTAGATRGDPDGARWTGNPDDCPADAPEFGDACTVAEDEICAFRTPNAAGDHQNYQACACVLAVGGGRVWDCYAQGGGGPPCPDAQPEDGADCFGMIDQLCNYPYKTVCSCDSSSATWSCQANPPPVAANDQSSVDPAKPVNQLGDGERATWCRWYVDLLAGGPGRPEPEDTVDANGFALASGCMTAIGAFECAGAMPRLSSSDCAANLALSSCTASVGALSDCVRTFANGCWPSPNGCAPYLDTTGCSGTIINGDAPTPAPGAGGAGNLPGAGALGGAPSVAAREQACSVKVR